MDFNDRDVEWTGRYGELLLMVRWVSGRLGYKSVSGKEDLKSRGVQT